MIRKVGILLVAALVGYIVAKKTPLTLPVIG